MRMTETCTAEAFCLTFPLHYLIFFQITTTLPLNDVNTQSYRDLVVSNIKSAFYRYAPGADFKMEIWSGDFKIK